MFVFACCQYTCVEKIVIQTYFSLCAIYSLRRYDQNSEEGRRAGKPLANGFRGMLLGLVGDLDYFANILKVNKYNLSNKFCCYCQAASTGDLTFTDNRLDAPWTKTCYTPASWHASQGSVLHDFFVQFVLHTCLLIVEKYVAHNIQNNKYKIKPFLR